MATTADIRNGLCIELEGDIYVIVEFQHVKPGKGNAFVRTRIRNLRTGRVLDHTFQAGHKVNDVRVERRQYQFLYNDESGYHFMNNEDFDQIALNGAIIDNPEFLQEGMVVEVLIHADSETPLTCELPQFVEMEVTYTEPGVRGDTASTNVMKPATLESGAEVKVPLFVNQGDKIRVDTRTGTYMERVKK
jgi:elongation factor P